MAGSELCSTHLSPRRGPGRPSLLTPEVADTIVTSLRAGNYIQVACRSAGISRQAYGDWMRKGAQKPGPYRQFRERVERALAEGEVRNVALISQAAKESWTAAAWLLERMYPERWGRVSTRLRLELGEPQTVTVEEHDPFEEVDELAEARRRRGAS